MVRSKASERDKRKTYYEEHPKAPPRIFQREQRTKRISAPCCIPLSLAGFARGKTPCVLCLFLYDYNGGTMARHYTLPPTEYDYDEIFNQQEENEAQLQLLNDPHIVKYRTKTIKSGNFLEVEVYPIWDTRSATARARRTKRKPRGAKTAQLQERNEKRYTPYKRKLYRLGFLGNVYIRKPQTSEIATRRAKRNVKVYSTLKVLRRKTRLPAAKNTFTLRNLKTTKKKANTAYTTTS